MNVVSVISNLFKTSWGWSRWVRLVIGVAFLFDSFNKGSEMVAFMGAFLVYQAVFNTGCGFGNSCSPSTDSNSKAPDISHNFISYNYKKSS